MVQDMEIRGSYPSNIQFQELFMPFRIWIIARIVLKNLFVEWQPKDLSIYESRIRFRFIHPRCHSRRCPRTIRSSFYSRFVRFLVKFINLSRDTAGRYRAAWIRVSRKPTSVTDELGRGSRNKTPFKDEHRIPGRIFCHKHPHWRNLPWIIGPMATLFSIHCCVVANILLLRRFLSTKLPLFVVFSS